MNSTSVSTCARRQSRAKKKTVSIPPTRKFHHSQLPAMPLLATSSVTASGVSAANVVATMPVPARNHPSRLPPRKNSPVSRPARRVKYSAIASEAMKYAMTTAQSRPESVRASPGSSWIAAIRSVGITGSPLPRVVDVMLTAEAGKRCRRPTPRQRPATGAHAVRRRRLAGLLERAHRSLSDTSCTRRSFPHDAPPSSAASGSRGSSSSSSGKSARIMIITIDGPAGTGKSTVALAVAERLGFDFLDTGAMYRAVGFEALRRRADLENHRELEFVARHARIEFDWSRHPPGVLLNGEPVGHLLRGIDATRAASYVAVVPGIREMLVQQQRRIGGERVNLVTEGRDQGSVVFPHAEFKF